MQPPNQPKPKIFEKWERIRLAREAAGLTREELEQRINAGRGMCQKWEADPKAGDSRNIKDGTLLNIAMATGVRFAWIREGEEPMWDTPNLKIGQRLAALLNEKGHPESLDKRDQSLLSRILDHGTRGLDEMVALERILRTFGHSTEDVERVLTGPEAKKESAHTRARRKGLLDWAQAQDVDVSKMPEHEAIALMNSSRQRFTPVPVYGVKAAAGTPYENGLEDIEDEIQFSTKYLRYGLRVQPHHVAVVHVEGDSMQGPPANLSNGDLILVDLKRESAHGDGIFLIRHGEGNLVKSLQRLPGGAIRVISTNPIYPPYTITPEEGESSGFEIIGRVICALKRL